MTRLHRRVRFANNLGGRLVSAVHEVPRGGRDQEPGYVARTHRVEALKLHGIQASRSGLERDFGDTTTKGRFREHVEGRRGTYTHAMARRDMWHADKYGSPLYQAYDTADGHTIFVHRYEPSAHAHRVAEMAADHLAGRTRLRP